MRIADTVQDSIVDGPGLRFVVFTQGCEMNCPGCHNPQTHDKNGGREVPVEELISQMRSNPLTDGLTLSGGEPFLQARDCAKLAKAARKIGLNVWCYSGYTYEYLFEKAKNDANYGALLRYTDVLVDGGYMKEQGSLTLKWRGSRNQRLIDLKNAADLEDMKGELGKNG